MKNRPLTLTNYPSTSPQFLLNVCSEEMKAALIPHTTGALWFLRLTPLHCSIHGEELTRALVYSCCAFVLLAKAPETLWLHFQVENTDTPEPKRVE